MEERIHLPEFESVDGIDILSHHRSFSLHVPNQYQIIYSALAPYTIQHDMKAPPAPAADEIAAHLDFDPVPIDRILPTSKRRPQGASEPPQFRTGHNQQTEN